MTNEKRQPSSLKKQILEKSPGEDAGPEAFRPEQWLSILLLLGLVGWAGYCMFLPFVFYISAIAFAVALVAMAVQFLKSRGYV